MDHWKDPSYRDEGGTPVKMLCEAAEITPATWNGPDLSELLPYDDELVAEREASDFFEATVTFKETGNEVRIIGSKKHIVEYGLSWSEGGHCFRPDIFDHLEPFIHKEYFEVQALQV
jgi:hypothetical protein